MTGNKACGSLHPVPPTLCYFLLFLWRCSHYLKFSFFIFFPFFPYAAPSAYGSFQARVQIRATAASLHHSHSNMGSKPSLWPTPQLMAMLVSLTHWVRPGIKLASSWILARFVFVTPNRNPLVLFWKHVAAPLAYGSSQAKDQTGATTETTPSS